MKSKDRFRVTVYILICLFLIFGFSCAKKAEKQKQFRIGFLKPVPHPQLDMIERVFISELDSLGYKDGKQIQIERQNANGDMPTMQTIARKFVDEKKDLIVTLATPSTQAVANLTKTIPIVFCAVTDPVGAGIVASLDSTGNNVTGVSDAFPVERQIDLIFQILPKTKRIGIPYNPGETNSTLVVERIKRYAKQKGFEVLTAAASNSNEVYAATKSLVGRVDVLYTAADLTIATAYEAVIKVAVENKIPFFVSAEDGVERGALATLGLDYEQAARETAKMVAKILGGIPPKNIPVKVFEEGALYINTTAAEKMNVKLSNQIIEKAVKVYK